MAVEPRKGRIVSAVRGGNFTTEVEDQAITFPAGAGGDKAVRGGGTR